MWPGDSCPIEHGEEAVFWYTHVPHSHLLLSLAGLTSDGSRSRVGAKTSFNEPPNTHVAVFDAALPGSQPVCEGDTGNAQRSHGG